MRRLLLGVLVLACATPALASGDAHADPVAPVLLALALILVAAKAGGDLATRMGQPAVLGELVAGVIIGNLDLAGVHAFAFIRADAAVDMLARLGVILLLFEVGLESTVRQMMQVGLTALAVAVIGVVTPMALGWGVGRLMLPGHSVYVHAFLGATLTATSVGITARVLKDLARAHTAEARIILGAAVIDDVLGLVVLAVVSGVIHAADAGTRMSVAAITLVFAKALGFLVAALVAGALLSRRLFRVASRLKVRGVLLATTLAVCFVVSWAAGEFGLAPIVGAFAAGLILEDTHFADFKDRGEHTLEELLQPITSFLVPVFFVLMGMRVELATFADLNILGLAGLLTLAAIAGKQACALVAGRGTDRLSVGIGMIPRGEVGLIFANIGLQLTVAGEHIIEAATYSAVVIMVIVTTMVTPPALKWSMSRRPIPLP